MKVRQRFKLGAGAGLATMLLGALMVLAPGAGAGDHGGGGNEECPAGTTQVAKFNFQGGSYVQEGGPGPVTITSGATAQGGSWTSTTAIAAVVVKGSTDAKTVPVTGDGLSGSFDGTGLLNGGGNQPGISNVKFCAAQPAQPTAGSVTIVKQVTGAVPATWSFDFSTGTGDVTLSGTDADRSDSAVRSPLTGGTTYTVSEKSEQSTADYDYVGFQCVRDAGGVVVDSGGAADRQADVQVVAGENITCTFTNDFPSDEPDITIVKAAVAGTTIPATEAFTFTDPFPFDETGEATFSLTVGQSHVDEDVPGVEGGYEYREVADPDYPLASIRCGDLVIPGTEPELMPLVITTIGVYEDGALRGVRIIPDAGDVTCTFFNQGDDTPPPPPPPAVPPAAVPEANLRIVKAVEGDVPDDWTATFRGVPGNELTTFQLTEGDATEAFLDVAPGTYRIRELGSTDSDLVDLDCVGTGAESWDRDGNAVEVTLEDGDDVTCTFTNFYAEEAVLPTPPVVNPPAPTPPAANPPVVVPPVVVPPAVVPPAVVPVVQPSAEVKGDVVTRTLPRTGDETGALAGSGALLVGLGAALVLAGKRRLAR